MGRVPHPDDNIGIAVRATTPLRRRVGRAMLAVAILPFLIAVVVGAVTRAAALYTHSAIGTGPSDRQLLGVLAKRGLLVGIAVVGLWWSGDRRRVGLGRLTRIGRDTWRVWCIAFGSTPVLARGAQIVIAHLPVVSEVAHGSAPRSSYLLSLAEAWVGAALPEEILVLGGLLLFADHAADWVIVRYPTVDPATVGRVVTVIVVIARLSYHVYYGLLAVVLVPWAWLSVRLYRQIRNLWPFIICHGVYDSTLFALARSSTSVPTIVFDAAMYTGFVLGLVRWRRTLFTPAAATVGEP